MIETLATLAIALALSAPVHADPVAATAVRTEASTHPFEASITEVTLRRIATVAPDAPVTLGDVAELSGPLASDLAEIELAERPRRLESANPPGPWRRVTPQRVREAIEAHGGINLGRLRFRGDTVFVRTAAPQTIETDAETPAVEAPAVPRGNTVHAHALVHLRTMLDVDYADLRVTFDPADRDLLATSTVGRAVEIRPLGTSERTPMGVTVYERDRIVASGTITARVRVKRSVAVASRPIAPGDLIDDTAATRQTVWVGPDISPASPDDAFGSLARSRLAAGQPIEVEDVESPLAVRRGDRVQVHAVGRGLVVRMPGRARADARAGETLDVELMGRERVVTCRAEPDGRVVLIVDDVSPASSAGFAGPPRPGRATQDAAQGGAR